TGATIERGIGGAIVLFLVILCDYYYFLYCVITGACILGWWVLRHRGTHALFDRQRMAALSAFTLVAAATSGLLAGSLVWSSMRDPLTGPHPASEFSLDLLSPLIYGGHWRFGSLTKPFWIRLAANVQEGSAPFGFCV